MKIFTCHNLIVRTLCFGICASMFTACLPEEDGGSGDLRETTERNVHMEPGKIYGGRKATTLKGSLTYVVVTEPEFGEVEIVDGQGTFEYRSVGFSESDFFSISAQDKEGNRQTTEFTVHLNDKTQPRVSSSYPADGAIQVAFDSKLEINFDDVIDPKSIVVTTDSSCSGSVQVSANDFYSCIPISKVSVEDNQRFFFSFSQPLEAAQKYQVNVTGSVKNFAGLEKGNDSYLTFETAADQLLISELGFAMNQDLRWVEFYNASDLTRNLSDYHLLSQSKDKKVKEISEQGEFSLPNMSISPGEYKVIVIGKPKDKFWKNFHRLTTNKKSPYWNENGYLALVENETGHSLDFVVFGDHSMKSAKSGNTTNQWDSFSNAPTLAESNLEGFKSIVRFDTSRDSQTGEDWRVQLVSPGLPNDSQCLEDDDKDGIPDCSEQPGTTYAGLDMYALGARVNQRDVFVEIDYMEGKDQGLRPRKEALDKVVAAFAKNNIALHFDVGNLYGDDYNLGGGNILPFYERVDLKAKPEMPQHISVASLKKQYMKNNRRAIFHYMVFGSKQNANLSSGRAEIIGDDSLVTLGGWNLSAVNQSTLNELVNYQAATIMHELGHNFGLKHGGFEGTNNKANYVSVMNYTYNLNGLPQIGDNEGDRYYLRFFGGEKCWGTRKLKHGPRSEYFRIDFSHGHSAPIQLGLSSEAAGLGFGHSGPVDFNCDGDVDDIIEKGGIKGSKNKVLKDHDDWGNLRFYFADLLASYSDFGGTNNGKPKASINVFWSQEIPELSEEPGRPEGLHEHDHGLSTPHSHEH